MCNKVAILNANQVIEERSEAIQKKLKQVKRLLSKDLIKKIVLSQKKIKTR